MIEYLNTSYVPSAILWIALLANFWFAWTNLGIKQWNCSIYIRLTVAIIAAFITRFVAFIIWLISVIAAIIVVVTVMTNHDCLPEQPHDSYMFNTETATIHYCFNAN